MTRQEFIYQANKHDCTMEMLYEFYIDHAKQSYNISISLFREFMNVYLKNIERHHRAEELLHHLYAKVREYLEIKFGIIKLYGIDSNLLLVY